MIQDVRKQAIRLLIKLEDFRFLSDKAFDEWFKRCEIKDGKVITAPLYFYVKEDNHVVRKQFRFTIEAEDCGYVPYRERG